MSKKFLLSATAAFLASQLSAAFAGDAAIVLPSATNAPAAPSTPLVKSSAEVATNYTGQVNVALSGTLFPAVPSTTKVLCIVSLSHFNPVTGLYNRSSSVNATVNYTAQTFSCMVPQKYRITADPAITPVNTVSISYQLYTYDTALAGSPVNVLGMRSVNGTTASFNLPQAATVSRSLFGIPL